MTDFYKSDTYQIVEAMKATGNRPGVIAQWLALVASWAAQSASADAEAVKAWLPAWQVRPFYTAAELAPIFPALAMVLGFTKTTGRLNPVKSANRLANELKFARLPSRIFAGKEYFFVECVHVWRDAPLAALLDILEGTNDAQR